MCSRGKLWLVEIWRDRASWSPAKSGRLSSICAARRRRGSAAGVAANMAVLTWSGLGAPAREGQSAGGMSGRQEGSCFNKGRDRPRLRIGRGCPGQARGC